METEPKVPTDSPKPVKMYSALMNRAERNIGVLKTIAACVKEMTDAGVPPDVAMRVGTRLASRARELSK